MEIEFTKMQGAGNDFIVIDEWVKTLVPEKDKSGFVRRACDRHFGVGADGLIFAQKSGKADAKFVFHNPDGSRAEMCGNGIRCFAKYLREKKLVKKDEFTAETIAGVKKLRLRTKNGVVESVTVEMGAPQIKRGAAQAAAGDQNTPMVGEKIEAGGATYEVTAVGMGNPHAVVFIRDVEKVDVPIDGARIRNNTKVFPNGVNAHFVEKTGVNEFKIRSFERGVEAETLACGTGICASAVAAFLNGLADARKPILFRARGGSLNVTLETSGGKISQVLLSGPAETVYQGVIKTSK